MAVKNTQHFIHNPQAFLEKSYIKNCNNQMLVQAIGTGISNLASMSVFLFQQKGDNSVDEGTTTKDAPKDEPKKAEEKEEDIIKNIKNMLNASQVNFDNESVEFQKDLVNKYKVIKEVNPNITEEELSKRLNNYAKALKFNKAKLDGIEYQSECAKATTKEELLSLYNKFGEEFVELYDKDGNGSVGIAEMLYQEVFDNYRAKFVKTYKAQGKTEQEAMELATIAADKKAVEVVEQYTSNKAELPNLESDLAQEDYLLVSDIMNKFSKLDAANAKEGDGQISNTEAAAHLMAMAQLLDNKNNITSFEFEFTELAIKYDGMNAAEIEADLVNDGIDNATAKELAVKIVEASKKYNSNIDAYIPLLNN